MRRVYNPEKPKHIAKLLTKADIEMSESPSDIDSSESINLIFRNFYTLEEPIEGLVRSLPAHSLYAGSVLFAGEDKGCPQIVAKIHLNLERPTASVLLDRCEAVIVLPFDNSEKIPRHVAKAIFSYLNDTDPFSNQDRYSLFLDSPERSTQSIHNVKTRVKPSAIAHPLLEAVMPAQVAVPPQDWPGTFIGTR